MSSSTIVQSVSNNDVLRKLSEARAAGKITEEDYRKACTMQLHSLHTGRVDPAIEDILSGRSTSSAAAATSKSTGMDFDPEALQETPTSSATDSLPSPLRHLAARHTHAALEQQGRVQVSREVLAQPHEGLSLVVNLGDIGPDDYKQPQSLYEGLLQELGAVEQRDYGLATRLEELLGYKEAQEEQHQKERDAFDRKRVSQAITLGLASQMYGPKYRVPPCCTWLPHTRESALLVGTFVFMVGFLMLAML